MTNPLPPPRRRQALAYLASLPILGRPGDARSAGPRVAEKAAPERLAMQAVPAPQNATMLIAGPDGGELDRWGRVLAPSVARSLAPGATIRPASAGGADGVTGANQFEARVTPDGDTVLLAPGVAALAWLGGDPRAQFDVAHWVPVIAGMTPGIVAGRSRPDLLAEGRKPRVAIGDAIGPETTALLALEILGAEPLPVPGLADSVAVRRAFGRGDIDVALLYGEDIPAQLAALGPFGARPLFSYGAVGPDGTVERDPRFPSLPHMTELYAVVRRSPPSGRLFKAWLSASVAARMAFCLVLPQLTPAALVALWRQAGTQAIRAPELEQAAEQTAVRPLAGADAAASTTALAVDAPSLLEFRRWLGSRLAWHPG